MKLFFCYFLQKMSTVNLILATFYNKYTQIFVALLGNWAQDLTALQSSTIVVVNGLPPDVFML